MLKILEVYQPFLGMRELEGNRFTDDNILGKLLHAAGQKDGESWCCYMQEGLFKLAYPEHAKELDKLFNANCQQTLKNAIAMGYEILTMPKVGCLCIWVKMKNGVETTQGHTGLVVPDLIDAWTWKSAEGNSNNEGSREGYEFDILTRKLRHSVTNGLKVKAFINIAKKFGDV